ncbi:unnamed protein product, partial [Ilex paraguariensis]
GKIQMVKILKSPNTLCSPLKKDDDDEAQSNPRYFLQFVPSAMKDDLRFVPFTMQPDLKRDEDNEAFSGLIQTMKPSKDDEDKIHNKHTNP